jgi:hypothetical protein
MATYVNDLRLKEIATGDESGTWGTSVNTQYELIGEAMGAGTEAVADASTHTITMADGATDGFRCTFLRLTGGGQACTVTLAPNTVSHTWIIRNATSYALTFTQGSGANVIIAAGQAKIVSTDGAGSGAIVYECLEDLELGGTLTVGIDDTGFDVKFYGATSGKSLLWDESADSLIVTGSTSQQGTLTVGVDDTGFDVKLFGATSGKYWLWDESADGVVQQGTLTVGVDDTGYDVKLFGATSGAYMLWDESADDLKLVGAAGFTVAGDIDVDGTANLDVVDIDGAVDMASTLAVAGVLTGASLDISGDIDIDGTSNLDAVDVDGAVNFAADVTYADGADIITASAGTSNFRAGVNAGNTIESGGNYNVCVGDEAGTAITTGDNNVAVGYAALDAVTTLGNNTAVGHSALGVNTGQNNVAVGVSALVANTTANDNVAVGGHSGAANTTGTKNVAFGQSALYTNTTGSELTALGKDSLLANTTASNNTAVGYNSLPTNTTGSTNVAMGRSCLRDCSTGVNNTALGDNAINAVTTGGYNVGIGNSAGSYAVGLTTGSQNVIIGDYSHTSAVDSANQLVMGYNVVGSGNSTITVGNATSDSTMTLGGTTWSAPSDIRLKEDIQDAEAGLSFINSLRPITYRWKKEKDIPEELNAYKADSEKRTMNDKVNHGFVAQEVKEAMDNHPEIKDGFEMWQEDELDGRQRIGEGALVTILTKAIQELSAQVEELKAQPVCKCKGE